MREVMTKSMARNIFYGGSLFFILIFVGLTAQSHRYIVNTSTDKATLTDSVAALAEQRIRVGVLPRAEGEVGADQERVSRPESADARADVPAVIRVRVLGGA